MTHTINTNTLYRVTIRGNHQAISGAIHEVFGDRAMDIADKYYDGEEIPDSIADGTWHWIDCDHSMKIQELS